MAYTKGDRFGPKQIYDDTTGKLLYDFDWDVTLRTIQLDANSFSSKQQFEDEIYKYGHYIPDQHKLLIVFPDSLEVTINFPLLFNFEGEGTLEFKSVGGPTTHDYHFHIQMDFANYILNSNSFIYSSHEGVSVIQGVKVKVTVLDCNNYSIPKDAIIVSGWSKIDGVTAYYDNSSNLAPGCLDAYLFGLDKEYSTSDINYSIIKDVEVQGQCKGALFSRSKFLLLEGSISDRDPVNPIAISNIMVSDAGIIFQSDSLSIGNLTYNNKYVTINSGLVLPDSLPTGSSSSCLDCFIKIDTAANQLGIGELATHTYALTFYVDQTNGSSYINGGKGTQTKPFKSLNDIKYVVEDLYNIERYIVVSILGSYNVESSDFHFSNYEYIEFNPFDIILDNELLNESEPIRGYPLHFKDIERLVFSGGSHVHLNFDYYSNPITNQEDASIIKFEHCQFIELVPDDNLDFIVSNNDATYRYPIILTSEMSNLSLARFRIVSSTGDAEDSPANIIGIRVTNNSTLSIRGNSADPFPCYILSRDIPILSDNSEINTLPVIDYSGKLISDSGSNLIVMENNEDVNYVDSYVRTAITLELNSFGYFDAGQQIIYFDPSNGKLIKDGGTGTLTNPLKDINDFFKFLKHYDIKIITKDLILDGQGYDYNITYPIMIYDIMSIGAELNIQSFNFIVGSNTNLQEVLNLTSCHGVSIYNVTIDVSQGTSIDAYSAIGLYECSDVTFEGGCVIKGHYTGSMFSTTKCNSVRYMGSLGEANSDNLLASYYSEGVTIIATDIDLSSIGLKYIIKQGSLSFIANISLPGFNPSDGVIDTSLNQTMAGFVNYNGTISSQI